MSINPKDFRLPLKAKDGAFHLQVELRHDHWDNDIHDLHVEIHDLTKCKRRIESVTLTDWVCYDEQNIKRGENHGLKMDIIKWFMGNKGPVGNAKLKGIAFAHVINQFPSLRTPWVKDVRMDVRLVVKYTSTML